MASDGRLAGGLPFSRPRSSGSEFPAWDCLPYDRVSPIPRSSAGASIRSRGLRAAEAGMRTAAHPADHRLGAAAAGAAGGGDCWPAPPSCRGEPARSRRRLVTQAERTSATAASRRSADRGDYAVRGGIVDLFPPRTPSRCASTSSATRWTASARSTWRASAPPARATSCMLLPVSEVLLDDGQHRALPQSAIARWRQRRGRRSALRGGLGRAAISGLEHWLPLFYDRLVTMFDYVPMRRWCSTSRREEAPEPPAGDDRRVLRGAAGERHRPVRRSGRRPTIRCRRNACFSKPPGGKRWRAARRGGVLSPFVAPRPMRQRRHRCRRPHRRRLRRGPQPRPTSTSSMSSPRASASTNKPGSGCVMAAVSRGSRDRLAAAAARAQGRRSSRSRAGLRPTLRGAATRALGVAVCPLERGFVHARAGGDQRSRTSSASAWSRRRCASGARRELPDRGVVAVAGRPGRAHRPRHRPLRWAGGVSVDGAPHDCLRILYADGDRLYLPVENIEMIGRFGSDERGRRPRPARRRRLAGAQGADEAAAADMATELIGIAAARAVRDAPSLVAAGGPVRRVLRPLPLTPRPRIRRAPSPTCWRTCGAAGRPTG